MIYKRVGARLKAQDWLAIAIELIIVVAGVFIGMQVSNWNADRIEAQRNNSCAARAEARTQQSHWQLQGASQTTTL